MGKYNYRQIMSEKIVIQQLTDKVALPKPISLSTIMTFLGTDAILFLLFKGVILEINRVLPGTLILVYLAIPYGMVKLMDVLKLDGLGLSAYFFAGFDYWHNFRQKKNVVYEANLIVPDPNAIKYHSPKPILVQQSRKRLFKRKK